jgi:hypothetical protein
MFLVVYFTSSVFSSTSHVTTGKSGHCLIKWILHGFAVPSADLIRVFYSGATWNRDTTHQRGVIPFEASDGHDELVSMVLKSKDFELFFVVPRIMRQEEKAQLTMSVTCRPP